MPGKLSVKKSKKAYEESRRGGEFWNPDGGETRIYVMPPCREEDGHEPTDGLNYIPIGVHYGVGANNQMVVCLDEEQNPIVKHPFVREFLKKRGIVVDKEAGCPVCKAIYAGKMTEEQAARSRFQMRYMWAVIPWDHSPKIGSVANALSPQAVVYICGKTVYDGIMKAIYEVGDITDFDEAVLVTIEKTGKEKKTRYKVQPDISSIKSPIKLNKGLRRIVLDALKVEGDCDLFKVTASIMKSTSEAGAAVTGIRTEEDDSDDSDDASGGDDGRPGCFGLDCVDDEECRACVHKEECAEKCGVDAPGEEGEGEEGEEGEGEEGEEGEGEEGEEESEGEGEGEEGESGEDGELDALEQKLETMSKGKGKAPAKSGKKSGKKKGK